MSDCWPLLEMDDETREVRWRRAAWATPWLRDSCWVLAWIGYFVALGTGLLIAYGLTTSVTPLPSYHWVYATALILVGLWCARMADLLGTARRAVPRWLGLR